MVKMRRHLLFIFMTFVSQLTVATDDPDEVWKQMADDIDKKRLADWEKSTEEDRNEWTQWFVEQSQDQNQVVNQEASNIIQRIDDILEPREPEIRSRTSSQRSRSRRTKDDGDESKKKHECEYCGDRFSRSSHCRRHVDTVHLEKKQFRCDICNRVFSRFDNKNQHRDVCVITFGRKINE